MKLEKTEIKDVFLIKNFIQEDNRGTFIKTFNFSSLNSHGINFSVKENYYSVNKKNVIRGMHFQLPPFEHKKIVYVSYGKILDVVIDLRKNSPTFLKSISFNIDSNKYDSIYIPRGCAHGFKSLENNTIVNYLVETEYKRNSDSGIKFDSFNFDWGKVNKNLISDRDLSFSTLNEFISEKKYFN